MPANRTCIGGAGEPSGVCVHRFGGVSINKTSANTALTTIFYEPHAIHSLAAYYALTTRTLLATVPVRPVLMTAHSHPIRGAVAKSLTLDGL
jgi:hypothetical protein